MNKTTDPHHREGRENAPAEQTLVSRLFIFLTTLSRPAPSHEQIALVAQDVHLFGTSVRENIRYGRIDATDKEVIAASKKAFCHEFIMEQPEG